MDGIKLFEIVLTQTIVFNSKFVDFKEMTSEGNIRNLGNIQIFKKTVTWTR